MRFNSASCIEKKCLPRGIPCIKYAIGSKALSQFTAASYLPMQDKQCRELIAHFENNAINI